MEPALISDLFARQAARTPHAPAVVDGGRTMDYETLDRRSNRVPNLLRATAGPDSLVGVCLPRGFDLVAALLGTWKAGAAYVPLDPPTRPTVRAGSSRTPTREWSSPTARWTRP